MFSKRFVRSTGLLDRPGRYATYLLELAAEHISLLPAACCLQADLLPQDQDHNTLPYSSLLLRSPDSSNWRRRCNLLSLFMSCLSQDKNWGSSISLWQPGWPCLGALNSWCVLCPKLGQSLPLALISSVPHPPQRQSNSILQTTLADGRGEKKERKERKKKKKKKELLIIFFFPQPRYYRVPGLNSEVTKLTTGFLPGGWVVCIVLVLVVLYVQYNT